jgi:toxin HigB-1
LLSDRILVHPIVTYVLHNRARAPRLGRAIQGFDRLEIAFQSRKLRTLCESEAEAAEQYGAPTATQLQHRLADLQAALSVEDLPLGVPEAIVGTSASEMTMQLADKMALVFVPNHVRRRLTDTGDPDWHRIHRIKVIRIEPIQ